MALRLLDDAQVKEFVATGCLELRVSELGPAFHQQLYETCCERDVAAGDLEGNPELAAKSRREVFVDIPELSLLVESPTLAGALTSLLGPGYLQHPHRTMHTRPEGSADQAWHKDGHHISVRHHRPRWIIGFYFPGATSKEMGATGIMEGSYCFQVDRSDRRHDNLGDRLEDHNLALEGQERVQDQLANQRAHGQLLSSGKGLPEPGELAVADAELRRVEAVAEAQLGVSRSRQVDCDGGTVLLMAYGTCHRAARRLMGSRPRPMFKLQFARLEAPIASAPSWRHEPTAAPADDPDPFRGVVGACAEQRAVWTSIWRWMHGHSSSSSSSSSSSPPAALLTTSTPTVLLLQGSGVHEQITEVQRTGEAYKIGNAAAGGDSHALAALFHVLQEPASEICRRAAGYGLGAAGAPAVSGLIAQLQRLVRGGKYTTGSAERRSLGATCVHALGEACAASPPGSHGLTEDAIATLRQVLAMQLVDLTEQVDRLKATGAGNEDGSPIRTGVGDGASSKVNGEIPSNDPAASAAVRATTATIHALGLLGECACATTIDDTAGSSEMSAAAAQLAVLEALLPLTLAPDPCQSLHGSALSHPNARFWVSEGAAIGMARLGVAGRSGKLRCVLPTCPAHHSDQRYAPALCLAVAPSLFGGVLPGVGGMDAETVLGRWRELSLIASTEVPEAWLQEEGAPGGGVEWGSGQMGSGRL